MGGLHVERLVMVVGLAFGGLGLACSAGMTRPGGPGGAPPPGEDPIGGSGGAPGGGGVAGGPGGTGGGAGQSGAGGRGGEGGTGGLGGGGGQRDGAALDAGRTDTRLADAAPGSDAAGGTGEPPPAGCTLKWNPSAMRDGIEVFEFLELPDRNMIHPGAAHLSVVPERDAYRFDSHYDPPSPVDFDRAVFTGPIRDDRLRGEVRGMKGAAGPIEMVNGQTWRISWSLFIPATLKGTSRFTHIFQLKFVDTGGGLSGSPIITLSLSAPDNIALRLWLGGGSFPTVNLAPLHDKWLSSELVIKVAPGNAGSVKWTFKEGARTLVDTTVNGTTWPGNARRVWPKWGIYRGITSGVRTTYMLASDFTAYQCQ